MLLDILIILFIVGGVGFGFWRGVLYLGLALLGVYLGALVGRFVYEPVARSIAGAINFDLNALQLIIFLIVVLAVPALLLVTAHTVWGSLKLPHAWGQLDLIGGMLLGAVVGLLFAMFLVLTFGFLATTTQAASTATNYPLFSALQSTWSSSLLRAPVVQIGHVLYYSLLPNVGKTTPDLLQIFAPR
jgi:uncharacterized membrane protein required for colicin V production